MGAHITIQSNPKKYGLWPKIRISAFFISIFFCRHLTGYPVSGRIFDRIPLFNLFQIKKTPLLLKKIPVKIPLLHNPTSKDVKEKYIPLLKLQRLSNNRSPIVEISVRAECPDSWRGHCDIDEFTLSLEKMIYSKWILTPKKLLNLRSNWKKII